MRPGEDQRERSELLYSRQQELRVLYELGVLAYGHGHSALSQTEWVELHWIDQELAAIEGRWLALAPDGYGRYSRDRETCGVSTFDDD